MLQANELRIGNYVLEAGEWSRIYSLDDGGESYFRINDVMVNKISGRSLIGNEPRFSPIPLSPEILEACGFEAEEARFINSFETENPFVIDCNGTTFECNKVAEIYGGMPNEFWKIRFGDNTIYLLYEIKYIHQVQNLLYSLTGRELEIKMPQTI